MKKFLLTLLFLLNILALHAQKAGKESPRFFKLPKEIAREDYLSGVVIVKFKASTGSSSSKTLSDRTLQSIKSKSAISSKKIFLESEGPTRTFGRKRDQVGLNRIFEVRVNHSLNIEEVINEILSDPEVEYAEPRYIHRTSYIPNDPLYPQQSYLQRVMAPQSWDLIRNAGPSPVIIGIVDSGSEIGHPDLAANIYYNAADPVNGIDDDGNGKIDDYRGWDFAGSSGNSEDNNPNVIGPQNDHGVHVSGIASAVTDNGIGVSSIAFNTAKLLIVKAGPDNNGSDITRGYEGIKYAVDRGAHIINCSWGSTNGGNFGRDIINYAIANGSLVVAAAGNTGGNTPEYPAAYRGVMAVANTATTNDERSGSSNYGHYISITAPGNGILSTVFGGQYNLSSGTSMSAPVVSSTAALVKAYRPALTMRQVGELVRVTADDIQSVNPGEEWELGKGRVNVYRALTETPPAVRVQTITEVEKRAANATDPDTLYLYLDLENVLYPVNNLRLTLTSLNPEVTVLTPQVTVPALGTLMQTQLGPIKVTIPANSPSNLEVEFRLNYATNDNSYQDFEHFSVIIAEDYLNVVTPSVSTTITSNGRIGFSQPNEKGGLGFLYKGRQLLFEAALMIGNSPTRVSNNARAGEESDEHFESIVDAYEVVNNADSIVAASEFDDRANPNRLNVSVKHRMIAYKQASDDKYVIAEYEVFNNTNFELRNVHVGLYMDWDLLGDEENVTAYDPSARLAYVYSKRQADAPYAGVRLLNNDAPPIYYPLARDQPGNPLEDEIFTIEEKWRTLSNGVNALSLGTNTDGIDVSYVTGNGPFFIPANGSIKVAFALIGGDNLQDIETSASVAQESYNLINPEGTKEPITKLEVQAYPNPVLAANEGGASTIRFDLPETGQVSLDLYNIMGQRVRTLISNQTYSKGTHYYKTNLSGGYLNDLQSGIYLYRLRYNNESKTEKISYIR